MQLRPIRTADNAAVASVIRTVMPEFTCVGEGYSINDPEIADMTTAYSTPGAAFFVLASRSGRVVGCAGYAPLTGGDGDVCELRKMYILSEGRGRGGGRLLLNACLAGAAAAGYRQMYLETVKEMTAAATMYRKYGFRYLEKPLGATGHSGCDRFMIKDI